MNPLKKLSAIALLVLVLGIPAYAGDIEMPGYAPPPLPPPTSVSESVPNGATGGNIATLSVTEVALDLLFGAISAF